MSLTIHAFNTGRQYSAAGQRIAYAVLTSGNVAMVDIDRGLEYVLVRKHPELPLTDRTVLALYDSNCTNGYDKVEYAEQCAIRQALENAARAVQS